MTSEAQFLRPHLLAMGVTESAVDAVERAWSHRGGSYIDYLEAEGCISMSAARTLKMAVKGYVTTPVSQIIGRLRLPESAPSSEESALVVPPMPASARLAGPSSVDVEARSPREPMEHPASRARHRKSWRELVSNGPQPWLTPPPSSSSTASIGIQRASIAPMAPTPPADSVPAEPAPDHSRAETPPQPRPAPPRIHRFPRLGDQLGRYQLQERLGEGSTAVIYRSYHEALGVPVAVKVFRPEVAGQLDFLSEARTLAKLDHPNIVRVLDVEEAPHAFIVFEFVGAMTLEDLVRATGRLPADRVLELGIEIASGLQAAWRQDVLHRDVKPTNVLIRKDGRAKLVDFGLAVVRSGFESMDPTTACGSPAFMAPEQILHPAEIDHRADMYGLGADFSSP